VLELCVWTNVVCFRSDLLGIGNDTNRQPRTQWPR
jgi:hypothetical protein